MRPSGTSQQLADRRQHALDLLRQGHSPTAISQRLGETPQSVCRWRREAEHPRRPAKCAPGCPRCLSDSQLRRLVRFETRRLCAGVCRRLLDTESYCPCRLGTLSCALQCEWGWYVLQRIGWSCQQPQRRRLARDDAAIAHWKRYRWPRIKKVA